MPERWHRAAGSAAAGVAGAVAGEDADAAAGAGNEQIASEVAGNKNGIGYVGLAYATSKGLKALPVDGVAPVAANVKGYPYSRPTFLYTNGDPQGKLKEFIDFCKTPDGLRVVQTVGFVVR